MNNAQTNRHGRLPRSTNESVLWNCQQYLRREFFELIERCPNPSRSFAHSSNHSTFYWRPQPHELLYVKFRVASWRESQKFRLKNRNVTARAEPPASTHLVEVHLGLEWFDDLFVERICLSEGNSRNLSIEWLSNRIEAVTGCLRCQRTWQDQCPRNLPQKNTFFLQNKQTEKKRSVFPDQHNETRNQPTTQRPNCQHKNGPVLFSKQLPMKCQGLSWRHASLTFNRPTVDVLWSCCWWPVNVKYPVVFSEPHVSL